MDKKEIQNFIIWYIPAVIGTHFVSVGLFLSDDGSISFGHKLDFLLTSLSWIICGIWLFINTPKHDLNKWLWGIFGLGAHLFAIVLYFGYVAFNKSLNQTPESDEALRGESSGGAG